MTESELSAARTLLFVPGDRPERFDKAVASGTDLVVLDLEDAVAPSSKAAARTAVQGWLSAGNFATLRINAADTEWFERDIALCAHPGVCAIMLPKAQADTAISRVASLRPTIALIESAQGLLDMPSVAQTSGVVRLAFGAIDLALDLDTSAPDVVFDSFRLQMVVASRAAGLVGPVDGVTVDFRDSAIIGADVHRARALGFTGKLCIHPAQIAPVHDALRPASAELEKARAIVAADQASLGAAVSLDGQMIDRPVAERARRLLEANR